MARQGKEALRVGLVQMAARADRESTVSVALAGIREAAGRGAKLVCLQELFAGPYFCQSEDPRLFDLAEPLDGPTVRQVAQVAAELGVFVSVPVFERRAPGLYHNSAALVDASGQTCSTYRKMHIPDDPQFMEKFYFTPGDLGFVCAKTDIAAIGTLICWDQWYPEAARLTALEGAELLLYPTAIGWLADEKERDGAAQLDAWKTVQRAHAVQNGVFVLATNRVGREGPADAGIEFWGHSFVADPTGRILAEAGEGEEVLIADLDLGLIEETRRWWPFFRDRRIDAYGGLTKRWS
jgi:N-carbamoylputrescine amidase